MFPGITPLLVIVGIGGFLAYQHFFPKAPPLPTRVAAKPQPMPPAATSAPTPSDTLNALAAAPGKMISDAQNAIAARRSGEQGRVDGSFNGDDAGGQRALRTPLPGELGGARVSSPSAPLLGKVAAMITVAPGVTAMTEIRASAEASEAFRSFVAEAKVTGVNQATPPVAFVNGRLIRVDQLVDEGLSITFSGVDAENRLLLFKDRNGAVVSKRY
jgi:hypothetical protein